MNCDFAEKLKGKEITTAAITVAEKLKVKVREF